MNTDYYFDFAVAPYALPQVLEALHWNGIKDGWITMEDNDIHIRWKRDINRYTKQNENNTNNQGVVPKV